MLERRRVEDHVGAALGEDRVDRSLVPDVAQHDLVGVEQRPPVDRQLHGVQGRLVAVQHHQLGRPEPVDLAAELGADRATGPGDEDLAAGQVARDRVDVGVELVASEHVGEVDVAQVADADVVGEQLRRGREDLDRHLGLEGGEPDPVDGLGRGARDRDDDGVRPGGPDLVAQLRRSGPRTGTSRIRRWRLYGSSSSRPTGRQWCSGSRNMEPISSRPASPAPTTSTREAPSRLRPSSSFSRRRRHRARPHAASTSAPNAAPAGTLRGTHWAKMLTKKTTKPLDQRDGPESHHLLETGGVATALVQTEERRDGEVERRGRESHRRHLQPRHVFGDRVEPQPSGEDSTPPARPPRRSRWTEGRDAFSGAARIRSRSETPRCSMSQNGADWPQSGQWERTLKCEHAPMSPCGPAAWKDTRRIPLSQKCGELHPSAVKRRGSSVVVLQADDVVLTGVVPRWISMTTSSSSCALAIRCAAPIGTSTVSPAVRPRLRRRSCRWQCRRRRPSAPSGTRGSGRRAAGGGRPRSASPCSRRRCPAPASSPTGVARSCSSCHPPGLAIGRSRSSNGTALRSGLDGEVPLEWRPHEAAHRGGIDRRQGQRGTEGLLERHPPPVDGGAPLCVAALMGAAAFLTWQATPQYASSARLFVSTSPSDTSDAYTGSLFATQRVASYADLVGSRQLAERVSDDLGGSLDPDELTVRSRPRSSPRRSSSRSAPPIRIR